MRTKSEARRRAILEVAVDAFSELGVEATTMSEIVARLGGSKSTIYAYFPSKAELVSAVAAYTAEAELQRAFSELQPEQDARASLLTFGKAYLRSRLAPEMLSATRIGQHEGERSEQGQRIYEAGPGAGLRILQAHLQKLMAAGKLRTAEPRVAALHLKGLLQAELLERALYGFALPSRRVIDRSVEQAIDAFFRAYGPD